MMRVSLAALIAVLLVATVLLNTEGNLHGASAADDTTWRDERADALPDLVVVGMGIEDTANTNCVANPSTLHLRVRVDNQGDAPAASFVVSANGQRNSVAGLEAGASVWVLFDSTSGGEVTAVVDVDLQVAESDEGNNQTVQYVPVPTQLPPCITPSVTPVTPTPITPTPPTPTPPGQEQKSLFLPQVSR